MPDAALILRRTLAERQLIGGEVQKPLKNGLNLRAVVADELATRSPDLPPGPNQNRSARMDKVKQFPRC